MFLKITLRLSSGFCMNTHTCTWAHTHMHLREKQIQTILLCQENMYRCRNRNCVLHKTEGAQLARRCSLARVTATMNRGHLLYMRHGLQVAFVPSYIQIGAFLLIQFG